MGTMLSTSMSRLLAELGSVTTAAQRSLHDLEHSVVPHEFGDVPDVSGTGAANVLQRLPGLRPPEVIKADSVTESCLASHSCTIFLVPCCNHAMRVASASQSVRLHAARNFLSTDPIDMD